MTNELYHHGILGMKWGVRRYQNEDGSLTSAGKKRYSREYERTAQKVMNKLNKNANRIRINAYNKAADEANNGGIEAFNAQQEKKYGKNFLSAMLMRKNIINGLTNVLVPTWIGFCWISIVMIKISKKARV